MDDYFEEKLQAERIKAGLADQDLTGVIPKVTVTSGQQVAPTDPVEDVPPVEVAEADRYASRALGEAEGDGVMKTVAKGMINGTIKAGESMSTMIAAGLNKFIPEGSDFKFKAPIPATLETNTAGNMIDAVTRFGIQFYSGGKILSSLGWAAGGTKLLTSGRAATQGVYADFTAFRGDEERLSNFLTQFDNPILNNTVTQYLKADADDGEFEGRMKNVIEGAGVGMITGVLIDTVSLAARGIKQGKKALFEGDATLASKIMNETKEKIGKIMDDNKPAIDAELKAQKVVEVPVDETAIRAKPIETTAWTPEEAAKTVDSIKLAGFKDPEEFLRGASDILGKNIHIDKLETTADVQAVMSTLADVKVPQFSTWSHETQMEMAASHGMDLPTLKRYYELGAVNEHVLLSSEVLLKKQSELLTDLINKNVRNEDIFAEVAKYQDLLDMTASFKNISGRTLDSNRIKLSLKKGNIEDAQRFMAEKFGGNAGIEKFKEAWIATEGNLAEKAELLRTPTSRIVADSALELWKNGILSGLKTFGVNFMGSYANLYKEIGVRFFSGLSGQARLALGNMPAGSERVYMGEALAMAQAQMDGLIENMTALGRLTSNKNFLKDFHLPKSIKDSAETGYKRAISADNWGIGTVPGATARYMQNMFGIPGMKTQAGMRRTVDLLGSVINTPGNLLSMTDGMVQNSARRTQRYALAYRKAMESGMGPIDAQMAVRKMAKDSNVEKSAAESTEDFAKRVTFQSDMGDVAMNVQKLVKGWRPFMDIPVLEFLIPFIRTPANIFKQGVTEVNPIVTGLSALDAKSAIRQAMSEGGIKADEALGRAAFGASLATSAVLMTANGMMTGAGPTHDKNMMETLKRSGWRPYSFKIENGVDANGIQQYKYVAYNRVEPVSWVMGAFATMMETQHYMSSVNDAKDQQWTDFAAAMTGALSEATLDRSFFVGVKKFFDAVNQPKQGFSSYATGLLSSFVPAISRDIEIMMQEKPYLRDVRGVMDGINARMIGGMDEVPVARNRWGDPISMDAGWMLGGRSVFSPIGMSEEYAQPIDKEIVRLAYEGVPDAEGNNRVFTSAMISKPPRAIVKGGKTIRFDNWQYSRLLEIAGHEIKQDPFGTGKEMTMREALNYLVTESEAYKLAGQFNPNSAVTGPFPETQARLIKETAKGYDAAAREQLFQEYPDLQKKLQEAERYDMMSKAGTLGPEDQYKLLEQLDGRQ